MAKLLIGHDVGTYTFNKTAGTITLATVPTLALEQFLLITDTTAGIVIYQFNNPALGGSWVNGTGILTLDYNCSALSNSDALQIYVDIPELAALTPPTAAAIGTAVSGDLLIGTAVAGSSVPVALPTATISTLTPPTAAAIGSAVAAPTAAAIASAIVSNPPTTFSGAVTNAGTFAVQATGTVTLGAGSASIGTIGNTSFAVTNTGTFAVQAACTGTVAFSNTTIAVTNTGTFAVQAAISGSISNTSFAVTNTGTFAVQAACTGTVAFSNTTIAVTNTGTFAVQAAISGSISNTTFASTAISGAYVAGSLADGALVTLGAKTDAKSTATDSTSITAMQVLKEISYMEQNPASRAVTNAGTFAVQAVGALTNNNAAPAATNIGALTALANAAAPTYTEGDQVLNSVDLSGHQRVVATGGAAAGAAAAGNPVLAAGLDYSGNVQSLATDTTGKQRILGANMNPQIVQGSLALGALTNVTIAGTTCVKAYTNPVKLGNTLVVCVALGTVQTNTITDSLNLQWQTAANTGSSTGVYAFSAVVTTAGTPTITITTASTDIAIALYEVEGAGSLEGSVGAAFGLSTGPALVCPVTQLNDLAFYVVSAGAGTITAASPNQPSSSVFDTGNIAVAGATNLKNFGVFSAQLGYPVLQTAGTGNLSNTFKATLGSSVVWSHIAFAFRPAAVQVYAQTLPTSSLTLVADALINTSNQLNGTGSSTAIVQQTLPMLFNGTSWDRQRTPATFKTGSLYQAFSPVWKPLAANKIRLMKYKMECTANAAVTTAGVFPVYLMEGTPAGTAVATSPGYATNIVHEVYLPTTAGTTLGTWWDSDWVDLGNGFPTNVVGNTLNVCINGPLASTTVAPTCTFSVSELYEGCWLAFKTGLGTSINGPAVRLIQSNSKIVTSALTTGALSFLNAPQAGSTLVVVATVNQNTTAVAGTGAITDTLGLTWTYVVESNASTQQMVIGYATIGGATGAADAVTLTWTTTSAVSKIQIYEYAGLIASADATHANSPTTGTSATFALGASASVGAVSDFVFAAVGTAVSSATSAFSVGTISAGFEQLFVNADTAGTLVAADNLNQLPAGFSGLINVICAGTESVTP